MDEKGHPGRDGPAELDEDPDAQPMRGTSGPGENGYAPGELQVARPEDYHDSWNPRYRRWHRLQNVVRHWIGGGG